MTSSKNFNEASPLLTSTTPASNCAAIVGCNGLDPYSTGPGPGLADDTNKDTNKDTSTLQTCNGRGDLTENDNSSDSTTTCDKKSKAKFSHLSRRRKYVLILCTIALFLASASFAVLGPFYPKEATSKGMSITMVGVVFGIFQAVIFLTAPFIGNFTVKLGPKFVYLSGIFLGGSCTILFGTLDRCPPGNSFMVLSLLCRVVQALGYSAFQTASFAIVSNEYSEAIGTAFGILETGSGIGYMVGPAIGGFLYDFGGFGFPFYVIGVMVLLNGILIFNFLPVPESVANSRRQSVFSLTRNSLVLIAMASTMVGLFAMTAFDSSLSKHLSYFKLSTSLIGLFFVIAAGLYSTMAPVWGFVSDKLDIQAPLIVGGHFVYGIGFLVTGPSPLFPFIPIELWAMIVGPIFIGVSFGCLVIPTMKLMVKGALELGFGDNLDTYALVAGLFNSTCCLGGALGPVVGNFLIDQYGYPIGYSAIGLIQIFMVAVTSVFYSIRHVKNSRKKATDEEGTIIIQSNPDDDVELSGKGQRAESVH